MSPFVLVKAGVQIVAALGVTKVFTEVIKNNTTIVTTVDKILINTGSLVLGSVIVDHTSDRVNYAFEKFENWKEERKDEIEAAKEKAKEAKDKAKEKLSDMTDEKENGNNPEASV